MRRHRLLHVTAVALGLLFTLTGCVKLDMDLTVRSNDTVDGTVILAVDKSLLAASGQDQQQLRDQLEKQGPFPAADRPKTGKFSQRPYDKDGKIGEAYLFSGVPLAEFGKGSGTGLKITHKGDRYFVNGQLDLTSKSTDPDQQARAKQAATSADLRIRITFPGEVLKSNGEISGRSVTWHPKLGQTTTLTAEARTTAVIPKLLAWAGGVVGLLLLIGLVALLLMLRRRRRARSYYAASPGYPPPDYPPARDAYVAPYAPPAPQQEYGGPPSPYAPQSGGYDAPGYDAPGYDAPAPYSPPHGPPAGGYGGAAPQPGGYGGATPDDRTMQLPPVDPTRPAPPDEASPQR